MLTKFASSLIKSAVSKSSPGLVGASVRASSSDVATPKFPPKHVADMDDMPVPSGSWQEYYDQRQRRFNTQLAASVILFVGSVLYLRETVFFNYSPPELPEEMKNFHPWKDRRE